VTAGVTPALRIITFGDLDAGLSGAAWDDGNAGLVFGTTSVDAVIGGTGAAEAWSIAGQDLELEAQALGEPVTYAEFGGFDQLCRVRGRAGGQAIDCLGRRAERTASALERAGSVRDVSCWFGAEQGLALSAIRPAEERDHDEDLVLAAVLDRDSEQEVSDPRLSTTYRSDGTPLRFSFELWLGEDESEQYPRRAAGEAAGTPTANTGARFELTAQPLRCHSRGEDGTGIYLLLRYR
jgi:hypothetical protein